MSIFLNSFVVGSCFEVGGLDIAHICVLSYHYKIGLPGVIDVYGYFWWVVLYYDYESDIYGVSLVCDARR